MKILEKITDVLERILISIACFYLVYLAVACFLQVFSRYVMNASFSWTEETARYAFAGVGMIGAPVALRKGMHVSIDVLGTKLGGKYKKIHEVVVMICLLAISAILMVYGYTLFISMKGIFSPSVRIPMRCVYYCVPVSGFTSCWMIIVRILEIVFGTKEREE